MSSDTLAAGIRHLRGRMAAQNRNDESDEQLLHAFTTRRDEDAFAVVVRRHGPMVLHVCRRVLGQQQDAEDAFQAVFLLLAQSAASLRNKSALAGFLHGSAYRIALTARRSAARRRKHEGATPAGAIPADNPVEELSWREVRTLLDEEIARLPEKYRTVFVLCYLENLSQAQAARRLGMKERTLSSRLEEARKRLGQRLARRGVELTALLAATAVMTQSASALPVGLTLTTIQAALATAGEGLTGLISTSVAELVQSATVSMIVRKTKMAVLIMLTATLLGAGTWAYQELAANAHMPAEPPSAGVDDKAHSTSPKRQPSPATEIHGRVFAPDGKPKPGAKLLLLGETEVVELGVSAADGRFTVSIPEGTKARNLIARTDDAGFDTQWIGNVPADKPVELHLVKDQPIRGRIVNTEGKPIAGVRVAVNDVNIYPNNSLDWFLDYWKNRQTNDNPLFGQQLGKAARALYATATDAEGRFVLHGLGVERFVSLGISGQGIAEDELWIMTRPGFDPKPINKVVLDNTPKEFLEMFGKGTQLHSSDVTIVAEAEKIIRGSVTEADTGKGRPNVVVHLQRLLSPELEAKTDAQGRYEFHGARKAKSYALEVRSDPIAGYVGCRVQAEDTPGYQPIVVELPMKKGVIITGKMIDQTTRKPISGLLRVAALRDNPFVKEYPGFESAAWNSVEVTDANGVFRIVTIPGPVLLAGGPRVGFADFEYKPSTVDPKYRQYFRVTPNDVAYYNVNNGWSPIIGVFFNVLQIEPDAKVVEQDIVLERLPVLALQIQDSEGKPLPHAYVTGLRGKGHYPIPLNESNCSAYGIQSSTLRLMIFYHPKRKLAAAITLKGDEKQPVVVKLRPAGVIKGRLLDADGKPLTDVRVTAHSHHLDADAMHRCIHESKQIVTDTEGTFAFDDMLPGFPFELRFRRGTQRFQREMQSAGPAIQVESGACRDLGAIRLKPASE